MSISAENFEKACVSMKDEWQALPNGGGWENVEVMEDFGMQYLRITRLVGRTNSSGCVEEKNMSEGPPLEDDDEEALPRSATADRQTVVYDVVHSPSYQVPVLYVQVKNYAGVPSLDEIHKLLVPEVYQSQVQAVGVMGALSMTDHPVSGMPTSFVHPCLTAEAMAGLFEKDGKPEEYLLVWMGLVGGSVGLSVPVEVARRMGGKS